MSAAPQALESGADRVELRVDDPTMAADVAELLRRRGVYVTDRLSSVDDPTVTIGLAPNEPISLARAASLQEACASAAENRRPMVLLAPSLSDKADDRTEQSAALGFLQAHGALVCRDPSAWIEALVLTARIGMPLGPRTALVASPGSLIEAQIQNLARESALLGSRFAPNLDAALEQAHDAVLVDVHCLRPDTPNRVGGALVVPLVSRGELVPAEKGCLVDVRHALAALAAAGDLALRLDRGLGPGPTRIPEDIEPDHERFARQFKKLGPAAGDHETKVLLAAYQIPVTRQAVATTASGATGVAKRAGFPVDIKPWGPEIAAETDGCPVVTGIETAAEVRRGFATVTSAVEQPTGAAVIVRATPPRGRELRVRFLDLPELGWFAIASSGSSEPIAAPLPLSEHDAARMARLAAATRSVDTGVDAGALANLLVRASYLVWEYSDRLLSLDLSRIVAPTDAAPPIVVDAACSTRRRRR